MKWLRLVIWTGYCIDRERERERKLRRRLYLFKCRNTMLSQSIIARLGEIRSIHSSSVSHQSSWCAWGVFIVTCQSRVSVCSLEQSTCDTCAIEIDQIDRAIVVLIGREREREAKANPSSMDKAAIIKLFYAFNCVRKPWRARMRTDTGVLRTLIQFFPCAFRCETDQGHHTREGERERKRNWRYAREGCSGTEPE